MSKDITYQGGINLSGCSMDEIEQSHRLFQMRGFAPVPAKKIRLEKDSEVRYNGKNYRVVDMMGSPKLEEIGKVR